MTRILTHRRLWTLPVLLWTVLVGASYLWNARQIMAGALTDMRGEARQIFKIIEAARLWNAQHGGVYGLRNASSPSNPYLNVPEKDIATPSGRQLTLLNPAYMTRQMSEVIQDQSGVHIHITSLKPINPKNAAQPWEAGALRQFEAGLDEYFEIAEAPTHAQVQYMAPLVTRQACLRCHENQGYKVGDIRGGISVAFDAEPFLGAIAQRRQQLAWVHGGVWLLLCGLSLVSLQANRRQFLLLQAAKEHQDHMVERRTAELLTEMRERKQAESFLRMLVNASGEALFGVDKNGRCNFCNPMAVRLLGYGGADEILGVSLLALIQSQKHEGDDESPVGACRALKYGEHVHEENAQFIRADGSEFPVEYRSHPIYADGEIVGAVISFSDITQRQESQARIWHKATHDMLTGLPNRDLLNDRLDTAIAQARRYNGQVAVLFVDLDRFKDANDRLGHDAGDAILMETARRMEACLRETDTVARLGGDEFLVVLPLVESRDRAERVANKIVEQLSRPFELKAGRAQISASIGIAFYPDDADNKDKLLRVADHAMYRAKDSGRGTWREYHNGAGNNPPH